MKDGSTTTSCPLAGTLPPAKVPELADLVRSELVPLLQELTGQIVLRRLGRIRALQDLGFLPSEET